MEQLPLADAREVLRRYGFAVGGPGDFVRHNGGFSGADVWQVATSAGALCLRRWPEESPGFERIFWIHTLLRHAHSAGCRFLPLPLRMADGASVVDHAGRLWEVTNWLGGRADESLQLGERRFSSTMTALAKFHVALSSEPWAAVATAPSPGLVDRLERLDRALGDGMRDVRSAPIPLGWADLGARRDEYLALFPRGAVHVRPTLAAAAARPLRLQPCIRDIRREHLLFIDDRLTGLVDFGAMQIDHPAGDVVRAVSECVGDDDRVRAVGFDAYISAAGRRFADVADSELVVAFDRSNVLLSPYNWLRWILVEGREFSDRAAVLRRFDALMSRLRRLVETG